MSDVIEVRYCSSRLSSHRTARADVGHLCRGLSNLVKEGSESHCSIALYEWTRMCTCVPVCVWVEGGGGGGGGGMYEWVGI